MAADDKNDVGEEKPEIKGVKLPDLIDTLPEGVDPSNLGLLMDVSMQVTVELGRTERKIKDILGMSEGTIITLDKLAGEPVDILVNGKVVAKGEVVVIDENFGVRITEIIKIKNE
ncbi:flagellar motor switch protein FliN [Borrelia hermsii]|uniref:Flagellar motor switch protein FliN n=3 Tax=Borrelia hermsii TaxID=140 RepID=A0AAN1CEY2_BORHE|nr:flagellar motor switch protein FliN [Borrelia hermsii]AAX16794.1 flagellar motor switch protein FliN [Borrelia hermsii DAH]AJW73094.1 flagellar motor switch protein FliN [Borrelia hermsii CC1]AMR75552.1 Flagellar motor switch protein fliN [Borrelia hermsii]ANA43093.1 flagellar motor switch protein FliN [Borrelia hermsii HS1]UCP01304.1 flagellar motor switch protein FliN [Borrelia hermsii]